MPIGSYLPFQPARSTCSAERVSKDGEIHSSCSYWGKQAATRDVIDHGCDETLRLYVPVRRRTFLYVAVRWLKFYMRRTSHYAVLNHGTGPKKTPV